MVVKKYIVDMFGTIFHPITVLSIVPFVNLSSPEKNTRSTMGGRQTFFSGEKLLTFKNMAAAKEEENISSYKEAMRTTV